MTIFMIFMFIYATWIANAIVTLLSSKQSDICAKYRDESVYGMVEEVFSYHSPFEIKNWFGFRHWFYPYEMKERN